MGEPVVVAVDGLVVVVVIVERVLGVVVVVVAAEVRDEVLVVEVGVAAPG